MRRDRHPRAGRNLAQRPRPPTPDRPRRRGPTNATSAGSTQPVPPSPNPPPLGGPHPTPPPHPPAHPGQPAAAPEWTITKLDEGPGWSRPHRNKWPNKWMGTKGQPVPAHGHLARRVEVQGAQPPGGFQACPAQAVGTALTVLHLTRS